MWLAQLRNQISNFILFYNSHMCQVAVVLDGTNLDTFHNIRIVLGTMGYVSQVSDILK